MEEEFSEPLRVIEPIEVYDPAPPPQLVADFAAVDLEAEAFMEPAVAAAVEEGAVAAGVAVPADAAAGTILETIAGVVVEAGWGLAGAMVAGAAVTAASLAFMGMMASNNRSRGDAPAPLGRPGTVMNPEIRQTAGTFALFGNRQPHQPSAAAVARSAAIAATEHAQVAAWNAAHGQWVEYIHRIWRRRAMADAGRRFVVMDPQTGLFRYATVVSYTYRATIWSVAGDEDWRPLRFCADGRCPGVVPQVSLPPGQAAWGSVVWPPENQDFHMRMEGVSYALHIVDINRIHGAPMTSSQLEWNRRASASPAAGRAAAEMALAAFFHGPATRQKFGLYKHAIATRHAMHGQHFVLMDPNSGLWRVARCSDYRMNPTRWTEATTMVAPMGEVTWPPLAESWRFGPWTMPPWVYRNNRAVGHTVTAYNLIHHAPLTPAQTAWNHRMIEMMRLRLGQRLAIHIDSR